MPPITSCFLTDINYDVCIKYLENKSINYNINNTWAPDYKSLYKKRNTNRFCRLVFSKLFTN